MLYPGLDAHYEHSQDSGAARGIGIEKEDIERFFEALEGMRVAPEGYRRADEQVRHRIFLYFFAIVEKHIRLLYTTTIYGDVHIPSVITMSEKQQKQTMRHKAKDKGRDLGDGRFRRRLWACLE
ncbi:MAG: hypothetical protein AB1665_03810 [Candidatus Thermoplasmatota archaeon]